MKFLAQERKVIFGKKSDFSLGMSTFRFFSIENNSFFLLEFKNLFRFGFVIFLLILNEMGLILLSITARKE
jgi:hypothetical protein